MLGEIVAIAGAISSHNLEGAFAPIRLSLPKFTACGIVTSPVVIPGMNVRGRRCVQYINRG